MPSDDGSVKYSWVIAVVIALSASTISNFGLNLQKLALNHRNAGKPKALVSLLWTLGFVGLVGGALCDFAALGFGAQSIIAPLGAWTLVSNVVIAPFFLGEKITIRDLASTGLIVAGCALSVAMASHKDEVYSAFELFDLYAQSRFAIYFSAVAAALIVMLFLVRFSERLESRYGGRSREFMRWFHFHRFAYAAMSGIAGAQSVLFAKTCVELVTGSVVNHDRIFFAYWQTYPVLLGLAASLTLQVYWMQCGLARYDALYCVPIFQAVWILTGVIGGGVFYQEFDGFSLLSWVLFPVGIVLCVAGVYFLSQRDAEAEHVWRAKAQTAESAAGLHITNVEGAAAPKSAAGDEGAFTTGGSGSGSCEATPLLGGLPAPSRGERFDRDEAAALMLASVVRERPVLCTRAFLGLGLRRTTVKVVDAHDPSNFRLAPAWVVAELPRRPDGDAGDVEASGAVEVGDVLLRVGGDSVLDKWLRFSESTRRLLTDRRPLALAFCRLPETAHRRRWLRRKLQEHSHAAGSAAAAAGVSGGGPSPVPESLGVAGSLPVASGWHSRSATGPVSLVAAPSPVGGGGRVSRLWSIIDGSAAADGIRSLASSLRTGSAGGGSAWLQGPAGRASGGSQQGRVAGKGSSRQLTCAEASAAEEDATGVEDTDEPSPAVVVATGAGVGELLTPLDAPVAAWHAAGGPEAAAFAAPSSDTPSAASQRTRLLPADASGPSALPSRGQPPRHPGGASSRRLGPAPSDASVESVSTNPLQVSTAGTAGSAPPLGAASVSDGAETAPGLRSELNKARRASVEHAAGTLPLIRASAEASDALAAASGAVRRRRHSVDGAGAAGLAVFPAASGGTTPTASSTSASGAATIHSASKPASGAAQQPACRLESFAEWGLTLDTCVRPSAVPAAYADLLEAPADASAAIAAGASSAAVGAGAGGMPGAVAGADAGTVAAVAGAGAELSRSVPVASVGARPASSKRASVTSVGGKRRVRGLSEGTASELASDAVQHPRTVSGISLFGGGAAKTNGRTSVWGAIGGRSAGAGGVGYAMGDAAASSAAAAREAEAEEQEADAYEAEVVVRDADSARSVSRTVASSHAHLRNITLDPVSSLLHMGSLIGPTALETADRAGEAPHPLAQVVFAIFPERTAAHWNVVDRVLDGVDSLRNARRLRRVTTAGDVSDAAALQAASAAAAVAAGSVAPHDGRWSASAAVGIAEEPEEGDGVASAGASAPVSRSRAATTGMV